MQTRLVEIVIMLKNHRMPPVFDRWFLTQQTTDHKPVTSKGELNMEEQALIQEKAIAIPGETIAHGMGFLPSMGTYRVGDDVVAGQLGLVHMDGKVIKLIPLSGVYLPKIGDRVIGKVIDVLISGWRLETNSPYAAVLNVKDATSDFVERGVDITRYFKLNDVILMKITNVTSQKLVDVSLRGPGLRKLSGGRLISVSPNKVPRIVGKDGTMISLIKQATGCQITVGQNGWVYLNGEPEGEVLAVRTMRRIEEEAHTSGLTDRIKSMLEQETGKQLEITSDVEEMSAAQSYGAPQEQGQGGGGYGGARPRPRFARASRGGGGRRFGGGGPRRFERR